VAASGRTSRKACPIFTDGDVAEPDRTDGNAQEVRRPRSSFFFLQAGGEPYLGTNLIIDGALTKASSKLAGTKMRVTSQTGSRQIAVRWRSRLLGNRDLSFLQSDVGRLKSHESDGPSQSHEFQRKIPAALASGSALLPTGVTSAIEHRSSTLRSSPLKEINSGGGVLDRMVDP